MRRLSLMIAVLAMLALAPVSANATGPTGIAPIALKAPSGIFPVAPKAPSGIAPIAPHSSVR